MATEKTRYSDAELEEFKELILSKLKEAQEDFVAVQLQALLYIPRAVKRARRFDQVGVCGEQTGVGQRFARQAG